MLRNVAVGLVVLSVASVALADFTPGVDSMIAGTNVYTLDGQMIMPPDLAQPHDPTGTTYGVYTGVATAAGSLILLESSATPVRDDVVPFDGLVDPINDYLTVAGGVTRNVTETSTPVVPGVFDIVVTVTGTAPTGGPGDLWPSGLSSGGNALTSGAFGIGLTLPASLGGADPLAWQPGPMIVTAAALRISTGGVFGAPIPIPLTLFGPSAVNWNGVLGLSLGNGATGTGIQDAIELTITVGKGVPEPSSLALLVFGAGGTLIRRRTRRAV